MSLSILLSIVIKIFHFITPKPPYHLVSHSKVHALANLWLTHWFLAITKACKKKIKNYRGYIVLYFSHNSYAMLCSHQFIVDVVQLSCPLTTHLSICDPGPLIAPSPHPPYLLCQPIDIGVQKPIKNALLEQWEDWMDTEEVGEGRKIKTTSCQIIITWVVDE